MKIIKIKKNIPKLLIIPLLILFIFSIYSGLNKLEEKTIYANTQEYILFATMANNLIHELQKERGYSSGFTASKGKFFSLELKQQRDKSNKKIELLKKFLNNFDSSVYTFSFKKPIKKLLLSLKQIGKHRLNIDKYGLCVNETVSYYTDNINILLELIENTITISSDSKLIVLTQAYIILMNAKEKAGIERALVSRIFSQGELSDEEFHIFGSLVSAQEIYIKHFKSMAPKKYADLFIATIEKGSFQEVVNGRNIVYEKNKKNKILSSIKEYVGYGGLIHNFKNYVLRGKKRYARDVKEEYAQLLIAIDEYKAIKSTTKDEIDKLNIIKGVFLEYMHNIQKVTKFHQEGKSIIFIDKIVKVDDKPAIKALYDLTTNIYGSQKNWFKHSTNQINALKNIEDQLVSELHFLIKKRSTTLLVWLVVQALILLIVLVIIVLLFGVFSELIESEKRLNRAQENLNDKNRILKSLLASYDKNVLYSSTNLKGIITDVSEAFCNVSGYSREELIGQNHNIVRHPDTPASTFKKLWELLVQEKTFSSEVKNLKKDGGYFWVTSFFAPEYDKNSKHIGYTAVRDNITDRKEVESLQTEIEETQKDVIFTMGSIGETRSKETGNHVKRVAEYSKLLYMLNGASEDEAELLKMASPMHDIGKVGIPDNILNKPGKLDPGEWAIMQTHSEMGYDMLKNSNREILKLAATVALTHHERYDGGGYPKGLLGNEIPLVGRITAVADVFDALGSDRCYKAAWELEKILELIKEEKARQFDPQLVDLFLENLDKFLEIRDMYKDII